MSRAPKRHARTARTAALTAILSDVLTAARGTARAITRQPPRFASEARAQRAEEGADVFDERLGLLERGEMPDRREARPALDAVHALRPLAGWPDDLLREDRAAGRHVDPEAGRRELSGAHRLAVETAGRVRGRGRPVEHDVRQELVLREAP